MRIGFDVDGIMASFIPVYQRLVVHYANGVNLFQPGDDENPPCWNWPEHRGYGPDVMKKVWAHIKTSSDFWFALAPLPGVGAYNAVAEAMLKHDVYLVTDRSGIRSKEQTENWFIQHSGIYNPTVLVSGAKGLCAKALKLDVYIDDKLDNIYDVIVESPETRLYLLGRRYNQDDNPVAHRYYTRVNSVAEMLALEAENL